MRKRLLLIAFAGMAALGMACKEDPKRPPVGEGAAGPIANAGGATSGDGGEDDDDGGDADGGEGGAGACTDVAITGAVVDLLAVADNPPPGLGGTIAEGTYTLTDARLYAGIGALPGPTNTSYQGTIRATGQTFERAIIFRGSNGSVQESRASGAFFPGAVNGNAAIALDCPSAIQEGVTFTATGNNVTITDNASKVSLTFSRNL
jgi:hypothetical protein